MLVEVGAEQSEPAEGEPAAAVDWHLLLLQLMVLMVHWS